MLIKIEEIIKTALIIMKNNMNALEIHMERE